MRSRLSSVWVLSFCVAACSSELATSKDAGSTEDASVVAPARDSCEVDSDCGWGEINREILTSDDCMCLYGCPYLPLPKATVQRRAEQHEKLCDPRVDGAGEPCGIDDCAAPPAIVCSAGKCMAAQAD